jgi:maleylpyruvate isomerase
MRQGEAFFLDQVGTLDDVDFAGPSGLPDWSRSYVVAHVARNADALGNLFTWARTGIETPMYASADDRQAGIEASSTQQPATLRDDVAAASSRLMVAVEELPLEAWSASVRTSRGRVITAADVPWMRLRETWVHAVDLAAGAAFADLPPAVIDVLIDEVAKGFAGRDDCPPVVIHADNGARWRLGGDGNATEVTGDRPSILAWLTGRADASTLRVSSADGVPPTLPGWL